MKSIPVKDPIWSEVHRLMRSQGLNESELLELLMKEHESKVKSKEEKTMNKEEERDPIAEVKSNKLDFQLEKISEVKGLVSTTNELIKQLPTKTDLTDLKKPNPNDLDIGKLLAEIKEDIKASKKESLEKLAKLNDLEKRLKLSNDRDETIEQTLLEIKENTTPQRELNKLEIEVEKSLNEAMKFLNSINEEWAQNLFLANLKLLNSKR